MTELKSINHTTKEIVVLGTGCKKCITLETLVNKVVSENNIEATVTKEEDLMKIMEYGVMATPAMVINGKVVIKGRLPKEKEILELINA
jgi:small redox-active disulfide protein 2